MKYRIAATLFVLIVLVVLFAFINAHRQPAATETQTEEQSAQ